MVDIICILLLCTIKIKKRTGKNGAIKEITDSKGRSSEEKIVDDETRRRKTGARETAQDNRE